MRLPKQVKKFFWDIDTKKTDPKRHKRYYVARILDKGDKKAVSWLFKLLGKAEVKRLASGLHMSPRSANYWNKFFSPS